MGLVMNHSKVKNGYPAERGVSSNIPITHLVTAEVFATQAGYLGAVLKIKGLPYATAEKDSLYQYQQRLHRTIIQLEPSFQVIETVHRRLESTTLSLGQFRQAFCQSVHDKFHQGGKTLYVNDIYLTLLYRGNEVSTNKKGLFNRLLSTSNKLMDKTIANAEAIARTKALKALNQKVAQWLVALQPFGVERLGENEEGDSALISFLSLIPNGGQPLPLQSTAFYPAIATTIQTMEKAITRYPEGHLGQYLANHRLFFGEAIQFQGNAMNDCRFGAMLSIKTYHKESNNQNFDPLLALPGETIRTQTFLPLPMEGSLKLITTVQNKKIAAGDEAASQIRGLDTLRDEVASGQVSLGTHHHSLMVLANSKAELEELVNQATLAYAKANMAIVRETLGQRACFFAQIPGNTRFIARAVPISSANFADFCSLHNSHHGYRSRCFLGEPITLLKSPDNTPVFWNYHRPAASRNDPPAGHALLIGPNGSGKTALATFLDSEMSRFEGHRTFYLDRDEGAKIYILACQGTYFNLSPDKQEFRMNPLRLPDTTINRTFCKQWMASLLLEENETAVDSEISDVLSAVVDYGFDCLSPADRRLSTVINLLPIHFPRWSQLKKWLHEDGLRARGDYAWAFDNENDSLHFDTEKVGFDLTFLTDKVPGHLSAPFYLYLLHRIQQSLTGCVTSILFDEMWKALKIPFWEKALGDYLPTIRKLYGHIVGMTQSPDSLINSPINHVFLDNNATLALFANPQASKAVYQGALGLSSSEFNWIKSNQSDSRLLLYKQGTDSLVCNVDLSCIQEKLAILSGNTRSVARMEALRARLGDDARIWVPAFLEEMKWA